jgi:ribosomal protein S18 acetylase RimI-like enzyme
VTSTGQIPGISIRPATTQDYEQIRALWSSCALKHSPDGRESAASFRQQLGDFPELYLVAADGDQVVGVVLGSHDHRKGWINRLAVLPEYRRRGIAEALVSACERGFRTHGIEIIAALIEPENPESEALFEKLGFRNDVPARYYRKLGRPDA